jgi:2-polyprenyl-3-methyl-5-hydroxy-6-metoxy-1,4-benzoquinol methylase
VNEYVEANRRHWDEVVPIHVRSGLYDVDSFKVGKSKLKPMERQELRDVRGKTMLHLQCHFGLDTLSWAREGAIVTGVDFSKQAIEAARALAAETGIEARFIVFGCLRHCSATWRSSSTSSSLLTAPYAGYRT